MKIKSLIGHLGISTSLDDLKLDDLSLDARKLNDQKLDDHKSDDPTWKMKMPDNTCHGRKKVNKLMKFANCFQLCSAVAIYRTHGQISLIFSETV